MIRHTKLSEREIEVLRCLSTGMTTKESAQSLYLSFDTVKTHKRNIFRKLDARNNFQLAVKAIQAGFI